MLRTVVLFPVIVFAEEGLATANTTTINVSSNVRVNIAFLTKESFLYIIVSTSILICSKTGRSRNYPTLMIEIIYC